MGVNKTFIIGDIHGCADMLKRLMDRIPWDPGKDRLVFVGDYIDRGPDSRGVVEYLLELKGASAEMVCLRGNHEAMLLDYLAGRRRQIFFMNGGMRTIQSYGTGTLPEETHWLPEAHRTFFENLLLFVELDDVYVVHAGFKPGVPLERQDPEDMVWIRDEFISSQYDFGKRVVFGHTPFQSPLVMWNKIGIDTGAVYGNRLTCLELPEERFFSVKP